MIGITGGTFDPVHIGHLIISEAVREYLTLDKVLFIPSKNPPHKDNSLVTPAYHRMVMLKLALSKNPFFELSDIEVMRDGVTYTVDTLKELKSIYGPDTEFCFICGADVVYEIPKWKSPRELFSLCKVAVVYRNGINEYDFKKHIKFLKNSFSAEIIKVEAPIIDISSSFIRNNIKKGRSVRYMLTQTVYDYIVSNNLYT